ncbi:uncharacterized protein LOC117100360 [Anneissia japonica]|uniref:uncharacterized protein LOC117100360 n=1 Tax=Anneissia japonica TaxID=1529436 RepID=UPI0014259165|nr:uncharacterized protein LOC117100360 [Anneissia japonica]XP_033095918.1 uncharacterized protein LOC117100360 [Anneissia japonica]XP_033095919.1 uncharacterized protein LOC117100360 [Anneissia japonica]
MKEAVKEAKLVKLSNLCIQLFLLPRDIRCQICSVLLSAVKVDKNARKDELDEVTQIWDCHRIQHHHNMIEPAGKPIIMYTSPELYNTEDKLVPVDTLEVEVCSDNCVFKDQSCSDSTVFEICCLLMEENDLRLPSTPHEAMRLYRTLHELIYREL